MLSDDEGTGDPNNNININAGVVVKGGRVVASRVPVLARTDSSSDEDFSYSALTCCDCLDLFPTRLQLLLHRQDAHPERPPHQCPACLATFRTADLLAEHRRTHTADQPHACPHCSARFSLKAHVRAHGRVMHPLQHLPKHRKVKKLAHAVKQTLNMLTEETPVEITM
ncbi:Zinc finger protein 316 [Frankliniella fusca]|uniref:Zinc finger protein 316 n=1 Tax=Frankliniella fusca TaxID=407009 RepID=A0AAE1H8E8_9NEOP|nr:Zinc finger protein 316 [Frankliniella fusca]